MRERMMRALAYERVETTGADALREWERLRSAGRGWPVIVGDDEGLERIAEQFSIDDPEVMGTASSFPAPRTPKAILEAATKLRWPEDLRGWDGAYTDGDLTAPMGEWPAAGSGTGLTVATDVLTGRPFDRVHILLIPTEAGWEVPAYLRWGGWNACPPPEYHVAALRDWSRRYGAELVGINGDTLNVRAAKRPTPRPAALDLAREQYRYCPDIVDQGVNTLSALAATLVADDWWFFWWD